MKKLLVGLAILALAASPVVAQMEATPFVSTMQGPCTSTVSYVLRGEIQGIYCDVPAETTSTTLVNIVTAQGQSIFRKSLTSDGYFPVRAPVCLTNGIALSPWTDSATNLITNVTTIAVGGKVTCTVIGYQAIDTTNSYTNTIIYLK